jgi:tetratricopeptide (TPR) repeat protein
MGRMEKTVFISYRRTNLPWARAIYQDLTAHGYDAFFDFQSLNSGDFSQTILENIKARAHFVLLLTPSALERCDDPKDWLRREIETAIDEMRNVIPVMLESFDFGSLSTTKYLTGKLELLKNYNALRIHSDYFEEGLARLRERFLNVSLDMVLHPISTTVQERTRQQQSIANMLDKVEKVELDAQKWIEKGNQQYENEDYTDAIESYTKAIRLQPDLALAYQCRGKAFWKTSKQEEAINDCNRALQLNPKFPEAYNYRGNARLDKGDLDGALSDFTEAIRLKPDFTFAYYNRGRARNQKDDLEGAIKDFTEAIRLQPDDADAYFHRGLAHSKLSDFDEAIKDYTGFIVFNPQYADVYWARGSAFFNKGDYYSAAADYQKYFDLGGTNESIRQYLAHAKSQISE